MQVKATLLGALFLIDFMYFETQNQNQDHNYQILNIGHFDTQILDIEHFDICEPSEILGVQTLDDAVFDLDVSYNLGGVLLYVG